jgi:hypothetical protein
MHKRGRKSYTTEASDNQSIIMNTKRISQRQDDTMIFHQGSLACRQAIVPIVTIHPLGGSRTIRHHTPNPQSGNAHYNKTDQL